MDEPDFRSDRSESVEGAGRARRAWDAYVGVVTKAVDPVLQPTGRVLGRAAVEDLVGFWVLWHLYGGFEGLQRYGYHRATIFRKVKRFRMAFKAHPDEYDFPGLKVDPAVYWASDVPKVGADPV